MKTKCRTCGKSINVEEIANWYKLVKKTYSKRLGTCEVARVFTRYRIRDHSYGFLKSQCKASGKSFVIMEYKDNPSPAAIDW